MSIELLLYRFCVFLIIPLMCLTILLYILAECQHHKWQSLGLAYDKPKIPFGSLLPFCRGKRPIGLIVTDIYQRFQDKMVGVFMLFEPVLVLRDAELVRRILTTDFASFYDRGMYANEKHPITENILTMRGQRWRNLRAHLTPAFSSGQMKGMFETMDKVATNLIEHVAEQLEDGETHTLDMRSEASIYAIDIIGSIIFGLDINSFAEPHNEFRALIEESFRTSNIVQKLWSVMNFVWPPMLQFLSFLGLTDPSALRMREIITRIITFRQRNKVVRKDTLHLMLQMKNTEPSAEHTMSLHLDTIAYNSLVFYIAGSESITSTTAYLIHEFALNPDICERAKNEVDLCLEEHGLKQSSSLTYAALEDMTFLDLCIKETLRKYPGLPFLNRECTQDYLVPGTDITIKKGTNVILPIYAIQRDPLYFPNPSEFIPERFSSENQEWNRAAYMPFGEGPRQCIAKRMGVLNVKVAIAKFLANFHIEPLSTGKDLEYKFFMLPVLMPKDGIQVRLSKRW